MAKRDAIFAGLEKAYEKARAQEAEELHNAIVDVISEHKASIPNALYVLDVIRFQLMQAKYKEIMGTVKLTEKPPLKKKDKEE